MRDIIYMIFHTFKNDNYVIAPKMCVSFSRLEHVRGRQNLSLYAKNRPWGASSFFNQFSTYKHIYTIKTQLICIYMFICTELIEESGRPPGLIFGIGNIFGLAGTSLSLGKKFIHLTEL